MNRIVTNFDSSCLSNIYDKNILAASYALLLSHSSKEKKEIIHAQRYDPSTLGPSLLYPT